MQIASEAHGHVGSDLASLCSEAALQQVFCLHADQFCCLTYSRFPCWLDSRENGTD